jgi:hypothetical protein
MSASVPVVDENSFVREGRRFMFTHAPADRQTGSRTPWRCSQPIGNFPIGWEAMPISSTPHRLHFVAVCIAVAGFATFLSLHTSRYADCFARHDQRDNIANATPAVFSLAEIPACRFAATACEIETAENSNAGA